jgi:hypothetical protein
MGEEHQVRIAARHSGFSRQDLLPFVLRVVEHDTNCTRAVPSRRAQDSVAVGGGGHSSLGHVQQGEEVALKHDAEDEQNDHSAHSQAHATAADSRTAAIFNVLTLPIQRM